MKIVHELYQLDFGGVERVIRNIVKHDKENSHTIVAYKDGNYREELEKAGAKVLLREKDDVDLDADLIHVHSGGDKSLMAMELHKNFPIIETIHSPVRSANSNEWITQRIGVCDEVSKRNDKCATIYNGVDYEDIKANCSREEVLSKYGIPTGKLIVGRLGRLGRDKGLEEWILTCANLQQNGFEFIPVIVGDEARDCEGYRGKLKLMCESLPLQNVFWIPNSCPPGNLLQIMDIFFYPSPSEGFGLVIAEAMLNNCCCVIYRNDVNTELFEDKVIASKEEYELDGLITALKVSLTDTEFRNEKKCSCSEYIQNKFSVEKMVKEYQQAYEQCYQNFNRKSKPKTNFIAFT